MNQIPATPFLLFFPAKYVFIAVAPDFRTNSLSGIRVLKMVRKDA